MLSDIINGHSGDVRGAVGAQVLGTLAVLAKTQREHDAEAVGVAMQLFANLFVGDDAGRKLLCQRFFGGAGGGPGADEETSKECLEMFKDLPGLLSSAKTHTAQMCLLSVLVRARASPARPRALPRAPPSLMAARDSCAQDKLGARAHPFTKPALKAYLPKGVAWLREDRLNEDAASLLRKFNDHNQTDITTLTASQVRLWL